MRQSLDRYRRGSEVRIAACDLTANRRELLLLIFVFAAGTACDPYHRIVVTVPLAQPLPTPCLKSALTSLTGTASVDSVPPYAVPEDATAVRYVTGPSDGYRLVSQLYFPDSTAQLETAISRVGHRFSKMDADTAGPRLAEFLFSVRDFCQGTAPDTGRSYSVRR